MHANEQLIHDFYTAFQNLDWQGMAACYADDIQFADTVFPDLKGQEAVAMWHMLCSKAQDFTLQVDNIRADDARGSARWQAQYTFSQTGRRVNNIIFAEFQFSDGRISRHSDHFAFWRWSRMALGPVGLFLGWSGYLKRKVQSQAASGLKLFMRRYYKTSGDKMLHTE